MTVDGSQFSWDKTRQSANFILIWGNTVGLDPSTYFDPNLQFNPTSVLDTMEFIYTSFKQLGFMDDSPGTNLGKYKIPIVIYGTWGANGAQGFANGGDADGVIGAFWVHPNGIHDGKVVAHEFTHSMQAQNNIDYRAAHGLGGAWYNAGIFWETHANYMRDLIYPDVVGAWGMDSYHLETWGDWKNTYENYELLMAIQLSEGSDMISRLWRESDSYEYPLQTYKRINHYTQDQFNDSLYRYARRMATFDFDYKGLGGYFRKYRDNDLTHDFLSIQGIYNILKKVPGSTNRFVIPIEQAPEEFAYNVIPLYPNPDSCAVVVKFKGHTEANEHAGWRYGFVAAHPDGSPSRYGPVGKENESELTFSLEGDETSMYLVVMGAPWDNITTDTSNDTWHGYPKHFRFPYELAITGAAPEGFHDPASFRAQLKQNGHLHTNGGGWVDNTAQVAPTVYVGPAAMVLGNAHLSGQVRVDNTAIVKDAILSDSVQIIDNAVVNGGIYREQAIVKGHAYTENVTMAGHAVVDMRAKVWNYKLSGTIEVGGDIIVYNDMGDCNNGSYYVLTNYYDNKFLQCDNRTADHPDNKDVNNTYNPFSAAQMAVKCNCATLPGCLQTTGTVTPGFDTWLTVTPNPASESVTLRLSGAQPGSSMRLNLYNALGQLVGVFRPDADNEFILNVATLQTGVYVARLETDGKTIGRARVQVVH